MKLEIEVILLFSVVAVIAVTSADPRKRVCQNAPVGFPNHISIAEKPFKNWCGQIAVRSVWTSTVRNPDEVVQIVNWARTSGWKVRAIGAKHNWSPLIIDQTTPIKPCAEKVILLDMARHMTRMSIGSTTTPKTITAETGVSMEALLTKLEGSSLGMSSVPIIGEVTLGGVLAIGGHGGHSVSLTGLGKKIPDGHTYGSVSNLILSLTAVVWNTGSQQYQLKTFKRLDPAIRPLLVSLGRAIITEVTLQVGLNQHTRCQSYLNISGSELFSSDNSKRINNFQSFLDSAGHVEVIYYPYNDKVWLKVFTLTDDKQPMGSKLVTKPYNFPFLYHVSDAAEKNSTLLAQAHNGLFVPLLSDKQFESISKGIASSQSADMWGWSKNVLLVVTSSITRTTASGHVIMTARQNVQKVLNEFYTFFNQLIAKYQAFGSYPINQPLEIRVTGLDQSKDLLLFGTVQAPTFSAIKPRPDKSAWNCAVWINVRSFPNTPDINEFMTELESWIFNHYTGTYASTRVEWSKGFAYTGAGGAWTNGTILQMLRENLSKGQPSGDTWKAGQALLNQYDPAGLFLSPFLSQLTTGM